MGSGSPTHLNNQGPLHHPHPTAELGQCAWNFAYWNANLGKECGSTIPKGHGVPAAILSLLLTEHPGSTFKSTFPGPDSVLCVSYTSALHRFWKICHLRLQAPPVGSRGVNYSLVVEGRLSWRALNGVDHLSSLRVLIDTGCSVPLIVRKGLLPAEQLKPARFPVNFLTASGEGLEVANMASLFH